MIDTLLIIVAFAAAGLLLFVSATLFRSGFIHLFGRADAED